MSWWLYSTSSRIGMALLDTVTGLRRSELIGLSGWM